MAEKSSYSYMNNHNTNSTLFVVISLSLSLVLPSITRAEDPPAPAVPSPTGPSYTPQPAYERSPTVDPNRGLGLTIAGFSTFGVAYISSAASGGGFGAIPIAGPVVLAVDLHVFGVQTIGWGFPGLTAGLVLNGVAQAVGLGLGIAGAVMLGKARRQARLSSSAGGLRLQF